MPKLTLEFNLPEERDEAELAQKAGKYSSIIWEVQQYARALRKYEERENIPIEEIVEKLYELTREHEE